MSSTTDNPRSSVHELIVNRWSPREFEDRSIEAAKLQNLFEAAGWAASCLNEQPWRFVTATRDEPEQFGLLLSLLVEKNQEWAKQAWLVGFTAAKKTFTRHGAANRFGMHDLGAASATLAIEAHALGLEAHFMGGFDPARAREEFGVPEDFEVGAAFVVGYPVQMALSANRSRKAAGETVFGSTWGSSAAFLG